MDGHGESTAAERRTAGRGADRPSAIPRAGWAQVLRRVKQQIGEDRVPLLAAGTAFYCMLALFPGMIAAVSIYGLAFDPSDLERHVRSLSGGLPQEARTLILDQFRSVVTGSGGGLTLALIGSVAVALWSASSGTQGLMSAVGAAYDEDENRSAVRLRLIALAATLALIVAFLLVVALLTVLPSVFESFGAGWVVTVLRWPLLAALALGGLAVIYRRAPDRPPPGFCWVSWGAAIATALWLIISGLFALYVANFGSFDKTYGSLGAVVIFLLWLWLSSFAILLGAEINAELERQAARGATRGRAP